MSIKEEDDFGVYIVENLSEFLDGCIFNGIERGIELKKAKEIAIKVIIKCLIPN